MYKDLTVIADSSTFLDLKLQWANETPFVSMIRTYLGSERALAVICDVRGYSSRLLTAVRAEDVPHPLTDIRRGDPSQDLR